MVRRAMMWIHNDIGHRCVFCGVSPYGRCKRSEYGMLDVIGFGQC